jgi:hypothetical protein|tara:strand:+ start:290 stop:547 length:258 start_codon:yes stop_codon:yes gene_type:complete
MTERLCVPSNFTKNPKPNREYFYWDKVVGRADEGLCEVLHVENGVANIVDLINNRQFEIKVDAIDWELNVYDKVYEEGLDWLNGL